MFDVKTDIFTKENSIHVFLRNKEQVIHARKNNLYVKDTANPLSHHVMASPKRFSFIQALAPVIINRTIVP